MSYLIINTYHLIWFEYIFKKGMIPSRLDGKGIWKPERSFGFMPVIDSRCMQKMLLPEAVLEYSQGYGFLKQPLRATMS